MVRESPRKSEILALITGSSASSTHVTFADVPVAKAKFRVNMAENYTRVWIPGNMIHWSH